MARCFASKSQQREGSEDQSDALTRNGLMVLMVLTVLKK